MNTQRKAGLGTKTISEYVTELLRFVSFTVVTFFLLLGIFKTTISAATYGEGSYGSGEYNVGEVTPTSTPTPTPTPTTATSSSSPAGPPVCNDTKPGSAPWLYAASAKSNDAILLQFTESADPVSEYVLEYGTEPGKYQFAMSNIGGKGTKSYLVASLSPNTTYYFRVRAGNGCATGDWSNELSAKTFSGFSFVSRITELETEVVETEIKKVKEEEIKCEVYLVQKGDSLSQISTELLGSADKYKEIVAANIDTYPSLETDPSSIEAGWELIIPCESKEESEEKVSGVNVRIKVVNEKKNPVQGAKVTLYSTPRELSTDEKGTALFDKVEPGEHRVLIAYKGQTGEQKINVRQDSEVEEVDFTIQIKSTSPFREPAVMGVVGVLAACLVVAIAVILKRSR